MRYSIFAHQSEYHLREELALASPEDIKGYDWQTWEYTLLQWPIAVEEIDMPYTCIMDEDLKVRKELKRD